MLELALAPLEWNQISLARCRGQPLCMIAAVTSPDSDGVRPRCDSVAGNDSIFCHHLNAIGQRSG